MLQYVPGVTVQQGEGHRDQVTIRGQETTADFYTDGVRDDIEYFRDLYNIEAVEVLKGPAALVFGRGGGGGIVNRVTKKAEWRNIREAAINFGMFDRKRVTMDVGQAANDAVAVRLNVMYEQSESFRDFFDLERYGFNPTIAIELGAEDQIAGQLSVSLLTTERSIGASRHVTGCRWKGSKTSILGIPMSASANSRGMSQQQLWSMSSSRISTYASTFPTIAMTSSIRIFFQVRLLIQRRAISA